MASAQKQKQQRERIEGLNYNYILQGPWCNSWSSDGLVGVTFEGHVGEWRDHDHAPPAATTPTNPAASHKAAPTAVAVPLSHPPPGSAAPAAKFCHQCAAKLAPGCKFCSQCAAPMAKVMADLLRPDLLILPILPRLPLLVLPPSLPPSLRGSAKRELSCVSPHISPVETNKRKCMAPTSVNQAELAAMEVAQQV